MYKKSYIPRTPIESIKAGDLITRGKDNKGQTHFSLILNVNSRTEELTVYNIGDKSHRDSFFSLNIDTKPKKFFNLSFLLKRQV